MRQKKTLSCLQHFLYHYGYECRGSVLRTTPPAWKLSSLRDFLGDGNRRRKRMRRKIRKDSRDTWSRLQFYREFLQSLVEHIRRNCIGDILRNDVKKSFLDVVVSHNQRNLSVRFRVDDRSDVSLLLFGQ